MRIIINHNEAQPVDLEDNGEVAERLNAPVLKTGVGAIRPWVRIPPSPPIAAMVFFAHRYSQVIGTVRSASSLVGELRAPGERTGLPMRASILRRGIVGSTIYQSSGRYSAEV
jgi:hypothetical protein